MSQEPQHAAVARLHREWDELHERLRLRERALSDAIAVYARGDGPRPEAMMSEVEQLRAECARRFQAMIAATREL